jgi:signal transduction histidine kinase
MGTSEEATPAAADLFASLAERCAALVDRQHQLLDALQNREEDPQRLAGLFSLDHVAAQLRRNSNAALVLAGRPTIRSIHVPTALSELASAAVCEVNGYQRVTIGAFPTRRVQSHTASDLVHLLGDLLENALAVSPRSGRVWVSGERPRSTGGDGPAVVRVGDSGTAVSDAALKNLNDMLAGRATHIGTGRGVGLVVAREIARRHSLTVQFARLASGGLVATVVLPDALFEAQAQQAPPSGSRGSSRRPWGVGPPHAAATHRSSSCGTTMHK